MEVAMEERREHSLRRQAMNAILEEREYQRERWSTEHDREHGPGEWLNILSVYVGKLAYETPLYKMKGYSREAFKKRLVQIAAIAMAAWEALSEGAPTDTV